MTATHRLVQGDCGGEWYSYELGDIRAHRDTGRLVTLRLRIYDRSEADEDWDYQEWVVADLLTGEVQTYDQSDLARETYTEMSALAYIADQPEVYGE